MCVCIYIYIYYIYFFLLSFDTLLFYIFARSNLWSSSLHLFDQIFKYILCDFNLLSILETCDTFCSGFNIKNFDS